MALLPHNTIHTACNNLCQVETSHEQYKSYWGNLNEQRKGGILCDVVIQSGSHSYHAHKCVLAAASPYFKTLFSSPISNVDNQQAVHFDHYSTETVQLLLDMIYGEHKVESADFAEMLQLAEFLQYDWLIGVLIESIRSTIDDSNCFVWHKIGKESGVRKLAVLAEGYITVNYNKLICLEERQGMRVYIDNLLTQGESVLNEDLLLYHNSDSVYVLDISKKTVEKHVDGFGNFTKLLPPIPPPDYVYPCIFSFFMYNKELFLASFYKLSMTMMDGYETIYKSDHLYENDATIRISRYNCCSQLYQEVKRIDLFCEDKVFVGWDMGADLTQLVYNNLSALYILFEDSIDQHVVVYKFDLFEGHCSDNYIMLNIETHNLAFIESKQLGTLLINGMEQVYNIEEFDFTGGDNHTVNSLKIKAGWQSKVRNSKRRVTPPILPYKAWKVVSLNGEVYFFAVYQHQKLNLTILHLNTEEFSWVYLCDFPISGDLRNTFSYRDKIFVVVSSIEHDEYCSCEFKENCYLAEFNFTHNEEEVFSRLYYFDHNKGTLTDMAIKLPSTEGSYTSSVVPAYLLV